MVTKTKKLTTTKKTAKKSSTKNQLKKCCTTCKCNKQKCVKPTKVSIKEANVIVETPKKKSFFAKVKEFFGF